MRPDRGTIYFLKPVGLSGPVKIGFTSLDLGRRFSAYKAHSPVPLEIVATFGGYWATEQALLARFATHRLHGEWFSPSPELTALLEALKRREARRQRRGLATLMRLINQGQ